MKPDYDRWCCPECGRDHLAPTTEGVSWCQCGQPMQAGACQLCKRLGRAEELLQVPVWPARTAAKKCAGAVATVATVQRTLRRTASFAETANTCLVLAAARMPVCLDTPDCVSTARRSCTAM